MSYVPFSDAPLSTKGAAHDPQEHAALDLAMSPYDAKCYRRDGFDMAYAVCPPTPRRGLMLFDPSYEIKRLTYKAFYGMNRMALFYLHNGI